MSAYKYIMLLLLLGFCSTAYSQQDSTFISKYTGQEHREIKSLSESDIEELKTGQGWGLAKAAELNGVPGPRHLLDMKSEINLTPEQVEQIEAIFNTMKEQAIPLGEKLIALERKLNTSFAERNIDETQLKKLLDEIADLRSELRFVHLSKHLQTLPVLTPHQVLQYNTLRGYGNADPCKEVPEGHDQELWRKHNNCD